MGDHNFDDIDVHFREKEGRLELACRSSDFAPYLETAVRQLGPEFGYLSMDRVVELNVVNLDAAAERRNTPANIAIRIVAGLVVVAVLFLAIIGLSTLVANL